MSSPCPRRTRRTTTEAADGHHPADTRVLKLNLRRMCKRRHRPSFCRSAFGVTCGYLLFQGVGKGAAGPTFTFSRRSFPLGYDGVHYTFRGGGVLFPSCYPRRPFLQRSSLSCGKITLSVLDDGGAENLPLVPNSPRRPVALAATRRRTSRWWAQEEIGRY